MAATDLDRLERRLRLAGYTEDAAAIVRLRVENQALVRQVADLRGVVEDFLAISMRAREIMGEEMGNDQRT